MKKILILNGPNLNLLGRRQPEIYGNDTLVSIARRLDARFADTVQLEWVQSNHEGTLIDEIQRVGFDACYAGIVLNAGGYTHTSVALADAIAAVRTPVVEVHLTNIHGREDFRHKSYIAPVCKGSISGFGADSYRLAIESLLE